MELKLKPCPFCGGRGRVRKLKNGYRIVCEECGGASHYAFIQPWHDNKSVAQCNVAKAWNLRNRVDNVVHGFWNKQYIGIPQNWSVQGVGTKRYTTIRRTTARIVGRRWT